MMKIEQIELAVSNGFISASAPTAQTKTPLMIPSVLLP